MTAVKVLVGQRLLAVIDEHLAAQEPERMLHVLGRFRPDGSIAMTHWVIDEEGASSHVHVQASSAAEANIRAMEREEGVGYLGVVHSHPRGVPEPSGQDGRASVDLLDRNPHVPAVVVGVVVAGRTSRGGLHVLCLPRGELAVHVTRRGGVLAPAAVGRLVEAADFYHQVSRRLPQAALEAIDRAHIVVVGAGSLGSVCAEHLVRAGVPRVTLVDPDVVEAHNLTRTVYSIGDSGRLKVDALEQRLRAINPDLEVATLADEVGPATAGEFARLVASADLVLGLADDQRAMAVLDVLLHEEQSAGVFAGVYRAAAGGDIVTVVPGLTACYRCTVAPRVAAADLQPGVDYTTGRLHGEVALGADVAVLAALTSRVAMGVLGALRGTDTLLDLPLREGRNYLQIGLVPGFFATSGLFDEVPGQHAFQSIWVHAPGDPDCPDCGPRAPVATPRRRRTGSARLRADRRRRPLGAFPRRLRRGGESRIANVPTGRPIPVSRGRGPSARAQRRQGPLP